MGTILGVVIGYILGTQAGKDGWRELKESWETIRTSPEVRDLVSSGLGIARQVIGQRMGLGDLVGASHNGELRRAA